MYRNKYVLLVFITWSATSLADVSLSTSIRDVYYRGESETAGSITMRVNADDFNFASIDNPAFIRINLDHKAKLACTRVDLTSNDGVINKPIYLAMRLNDPGPIFGIIADPTTVSIVRWVKGESAIWIRVQSSSTTWISTLGGTPRPPEEELTVSWTLGLSAQASFDSLANVHPVGGQPKRNLPFNTRNPMTAGEMEDAASTEICIDLTDSDLQTTGIESILNFDAIAYDDTAEIGIGRYQPGNDTGINFTNDFSIARGRDINVVAEIVGKNEPIEVIPIARRTGLNQDIQGQISVTNFVTCKIECPTNTNCFPYTFYPGSVITIKTQDPFGFKSGGSTGQASARFTDYVSFARVLDRNDNTGLFRQIDIEYCGDKIDLRPGFTFDLEVTLTMPAGEPCKTVDEHILLECDLKMATGSKQDEDLPFDQRLCETIIVVVRWGVWCYGDLRSCLSVAGFFVPYCPPIGIGDHPFWASISVVNSGEVDLDTLQAVFYNETGDKFVANLPPLPVHTQRTFLLTKDLAGTGLYTMDEPPIIPMPESMAVDPTIFGQTRMSLFVIGTHQAQFLDDLFASDIDGYFSYGTGTQVQGNFLPRNFDNEKINQNTDLPIRRAKN